MTKVLRFYLFDFIMVYLDNIIIFSQIMNEHFNYMKKVLEALRNVRFKLKLEKYKFVKKQLKYLRFIIEEFSIKSDLDKVKDIVNQPASTNQIQIRFFLGIIGFFRNHIQGFLTIVISITNLLVKKVPFI